MKKTKEQKMLEKVRNHTLTEIELEAYAIAKEAFKDAKFTEIMRWEFIECFKDGYITAKDKNLKRSWEF